MPDTLFVGEPEAATAVGNVLTIHNFNDVLYRKYSDASFLWNITQDEVSPIEVGGVTGAYGNQSNGTFIINSVDAASLGWVTGDSIGLATSSTIDQHSGHAAGWGAADALDAGVDVVSYYKDYLNGNARYLAPRFIPTSGNFTSWCGLRRGTVELNAGNTTRLVQMSTGAGSGPMKFNDYFIVGGSADIAFCGSLNDQLEFNRCFLTSHRVGFAHGASHTFKCNACTIIVGTFVVVPTGAGANTPEFNNCNITSPSRAADFNSYVWNVNNCTWSEGIASREAENVVAKNCKFNMTFAVDGTSSGNEFNSDEKAWKLLRQVGGLVDYRVQIDSPLLGAGVDVAAVPCDIDGNLMVNGSYPIGCSNNATNMYHIDKDNVYNGVGGNRFDADVSLYLAPNTFAVGNTSKVGTLVIGATPSTPLLSVADKADNTGATATVTGSDVGTTNTLFSQEIGGTTWTARGSRTGDGVIDAAVSPNAYQWYVTSSDGATAVLSNIVLQRTTSGADSQIKTILNAVADTINAAAFIDFDSDPILATVYQRTELKDTNTTQILVYPGEIDPKAIPSQSITSENIVQVVMAERIDGTKDDHGEDRRDYNLTVREALEVLFVGKRLQGVPQAWIETFTPTDAGASSQDSAVWYTPLILNVKARRAR